MKQSSLVILSLLILLVVVTAKSGLSHKAKKVEKLRHMRQDEEEASGSEAEAAQEESEDEVAPQLLNPLRHKPLSAEAESSDEETDFSCRVVVLKNDAIDENVKGTEYTELCQLKQGYVNLVTGYETDHTDSPNYKGD